LLVVCPNPKCQKEFEESILVTIRSVTPPKQYKACPYCFSELDQEPVKEKEISEPAIKKEVIDLNQEPTPETVVPNALEKNIDSGPKLFNKVKSLISNNGKPKKEKIKENEDKFTINKESQSASCPETYGYLANRPKDAPIPQTCLSCPKMVDCMLSPREK